MFPKFARSRKGSSHSDLSLLSSTGLIPYSHKPHTTTTHAKHAPSHTHTKNKQENHPLNPQNTQPSWLIIISKTQQLGHYNNNHVPIFILQVGLSNKNDIFHEFDKKKLHPL
jgi:hypothetical protein